MLSIITKDYVLYLLYTLKENNNNKFKFNHPSPTTIEEIRKMNLLMKIITYLYFMEYSSIMFFILRFVMCLIYKTFSIMYHRIILCIMIFMQIHGSKASTCPRRLQSILLRL